MKFEEVRVTLDKLEERGKLTGSDAIMYFVSPFLQGLGYNIFDVDQVDVRNSEGEVYAKITDDLTMGASLYDHYPLDDDNVRIFLSLGLDERVFKLYFKVLGNWEEITRLDFKEDEETKYTHQIVRRIIKDQAENSYRSKGEKFLTENVFNSQLERGNWNNDFMALGLLKELTNPSEKFIEVLAQRMNIEYTTKETDWIKKYISSIKEEGLMTVIDTLIDKGKIDVNRGIYTSKPETVTRETKESTKPEKVEKDTNETTKQEKEKQETKDEVTFVESQEGTNESLTFGEDTSEESFTFGEDSEDDTLTFGEDDSEDTLTFGEGNEDEMISFSDSESNDTEDITFGEDKNNNKGDAPDLTSLLNEG